MPSIEELEQSGIIAQTVMESYSDGRIGFSDADFNRFKSKFHNFEIAYTKSNPSKRFLNSLRTAFVEATQCNCSSAALHQYYTKHTGSSPRYWDKNSIGYIFVAWVLNLPEDYIPPINTHHRMSVKVIPSAQAAAPVRTPFDEFVEANAKYVQDPIIEAWKQVTSLYHIDVVLESLRRMGLNDSAIAALSQAASR